MTIGKDPLTADGVGGVHNVQQARAPVPDYAEPAAAATPIAHGARDDGARMIDDADQIGRVVHTDAPPISPQTAEHTAASQEGGARTPAAPHQDVQIASAQASVWEAARAPTEDEVGTPTDPSAGAPNPNPR